MSLLWSNLFYDFIFSSLSRLWIWKMKVMEDHDDDDDDNELYIYVKFYECV